MGKREATGRVKRQIVRHLWVLLLLVTSSGFDTSWIVVASSVCVCLVRAPGARERERATRPGNMSSGAGREVSSDRGA